MTKPNYLEQGFLVDVSAYEYTYFNDPDEAKDTFLDDIKSLLFQSYLNIQPLNISCTRVGKVSSLTKWYCTGSFGILPK